MASEKETWCLGLHVNNLISSFSMSANKDLPSNRSNISNDAAYIDLNTRVHHTIYQLLVGQSCMFDPQAIGI